MSSTATTTTSTTPAFGVRFTTGRDGRRTAYRTSTMSHRWFRMPLAEAELAVATGTAIDETAEWTAMFGASRSAR